MSTKQTKAKLSGRLAELVEALPVKPGMRVLEIGCGPGAMARVVCQRLGKGHLLAIDRSATAIAQARKLCSDEIAEGLMTLRQVAIEDFVLPPGEQKFDLVYAIRVGALDGRHPEAGRKAMQRLPEVLKPDGRVLIDGGNPLRELQLSRKTS